MVSEHNQCGEESSTQTLVPEKGHLKFLGTWTLVLLLEHYCIDSILCHSFTVWFGCSKEEKRRDLAQVVNTVQRVTVATLPPLDAVYIV